MAFKTLKMFLVLAVALMLVTSTVLAGTETVEEETPDEVEEEDFKNMMYKSYYCCVKDYYKGACKRWCKKKRCGKIY